jgi:plastocyanin
LHHFHRPLAAATLVAAALVPASAAHAATAKVSLGLAKNPKGTPAEVSFYDFFPRKVTIHAGDKVKYALAGFGFPFSGPVSKAPALAAIDPSTPVSGAADPAGNPFWFNGQGMPGINPAALAPAGDGKVNPGQKDVDHGALALGPAKPYVLTFPKAGVYKVRDALHPDVVNKVRVVKKGAAVPSKAKVQAAVAKQTAKLVKQAKAGEKVTAPADTILVGNDSKHVGYYQFFTPKSVKVGQPVTITTGKRVDDTHNLSIGPDAYQRELSKTLFQPGDAGVTLNPVGVYPSAPSVPLSFDGGPQSFVNTGFLDTDKASPLQPTSAITFTTPGTYHFVCNIHSDGVRGMAATITVTQ